MFQGLGHVAVYTRDMEESVAFYERLGGAVTGRGGVPTPEGRRSWRWCPSEGLRWS